MLTIPIIGPFHVGRRTKQSPRCPDCRMHLDQCICSEIRPVFTRTRLAIVYHHTERRKSTNTGRLALRTLVNSESYTRGIKDAPADLSPLRDPERRLLLLYPAPDAQLLERSFIAQSPRPITLVVPDGNWRQARHAIRREPVLRGAPRVLPPPGPPTRYRLRKEFHKGYLSTVEAIARAFGVLEGPHIQNELERVFDLMVERTLETRQPSPKRPSDAHTSGTKTHRHSTK